MRLAWPLLVAVLAACHRPSRSGNEASAPKGAPVPSASARESDGGRAREGGTEAGAPTEEAWEPHLAAGSLGAKYAALGAHLVDVATGTRARALPRGEITFAGDGEHFVVVGEHGATLGSATAEAEDLKVELANETDGVEVTLSPNGRATLLAFRDGRVVVVDALARTSTELVRPSDAGAQEAATPARRTTSTDGRYVAWVDGASAYVRDLDAASTRAWTVAGKTAQSVVIGGDVVAPRFDDELVARELGTATEIVRRRPVSDVLVAADGKTLAWEDATPKPSFSVYDVATRRVLGHAGPQPQDRGVCGGGAFHLQALTGTRAELFRECSLIDILRIDLVSGAAWSASRMESHTPAEDYEEEQAGERAAKRAGVPYPGRPAGYGLLWVEGRRRIVLPLAGDGGQRLGLVDVKNGKRLCEMPKSDAQGYEEDLALAANGKTLAGIDRSGVARLWEVPTCKVLFEAPAGSPAPPPPRLPRDRPAP